MPCSGVPVGTRRHDAMKGARLVAVAIPDVDSCEATLRHAAEQMCRGVDIIVIDKPPLIPDAVMPALISKINEVARDCEGQVRHHLDKTITATVQEN